MPICYSFAIHLLIELLIYLLFIFPREFIFAIQIAFIRNLTEEKFNKPIGIANKKLIGNMNSK